MTLREIEAAGVIQNSVTEPNLHQEDITPVTAKQSSSVKTNAFGRISLLTAAALDMPVAAEFLLNLGVPVDCRSECFGLTPLQVAIVNGSEATADVLLVAGADPGRTNNLPFSALNCAVDMQSTNRVEDLIQRGANVNFRDLYGHSPLLTAASLDDSGISRILIEAGADVNQAGFRGITALHIAAAENYTSVIQALLTANADVRVIDDGSRTPLMVASTGNACESAELLLDHGARLNAVDDGGLTPIARAIIRNHLEMMNFLADRGADLEGRDAEGRTLVHLAAQVDNAETLFWCTERNLPLDKLNKLGHAALYTSVQWAWTNAVKALLEAGANPNVAITNGHWTPLMKTVRDGNVELARLLINNGANLEDRNLHEMTPLLISSEYPSLEMIDLLLEAGARTDVFGTFGTGVLRGAMHQTNLTVFTYFLERGVDPDLTASNRWPVLSGVAWYGHTNLLKALLDAGADPNLKTADGQTPLFIAARRSQTNVIEKLLEAGADPSVRNTGMGLTPWHLAVLHGLDESAEQMEARMTPEEMDPTEWMRVYLDLDAPLATNVFASGHFNEWAGSATRMNRREDDEWWYVELDLFPGTYSYKFVVDGNWITDPLEDDTTRDGNRNTDNSLLHVTNRLVKMRPVRPHSSVDSLVPIQFTYHNRTARYVSVAGEFNGWNTDNHQLDLERVGLWSAEILVPPGEYGYKFVVDGEWILDPSNSLTRIVDGAKNSLIIAQTGTKTPRAVPLFSSEKTKDLFKQAITEAKQLDDLWQYYFETQDEFAVRRIISILPWSENGTGIQIVLGGAAAWSLRSNAYQHDDVYAICHEALRDGDEKTKTLLIELLSEVDKRKAEETATKADE